MILMDTDVAIDILRGHAPALAWLQALGSAPLGLPGLVVMELLQGCQNKAEQQRVEQFCKPYVLRWPSESDCQRALHDFAAHRLSSNIRSARRSHRPYSHGIERIARNIQRQALSRRCRSDDRSAVLTVLLREATVNLTVEAVYENGVPTLTQVLPLAEYIRHRRSKARLFRAKPPAIASVL
jgi:predicted nucleic acid-binding protein